LGLSSETEDLSLVENSVALQSVERPKVFPFSLLQLRGSALQVNPNWPTAFYSCLGHRQP